MPSSPQYRQRHIWAYQSAPNSSKPSCGVSSPQSRQKRRNRSRRSRRVLEELGYWWFEEPVQHYHVKAIAEVSRRLDITVSAGEQTYTHFLGLADLIEAGVRMVQPDIVKMGGIFGMLRCAALTQAHGVELVPHQTQPTIGHTANLHLVASLLHMTKPCEWMTRRRASTRSSKIPRNPPTARSICRPDRPDRVTIMPQTIEATNVMALSRCGWATADPLYIAYHDREWGTPLHDDRGLFELLILEGAQAGLSWITILRKRESYRATFDDFEPSKVAGYGERKLAELLDNPGIIRNRLKIEAAVVNAKAFIEVQRHFGSFDTYIWQFVNHTPVQNSRRGKGDIPSSSKESDAMSKDLRKRGFKFVGTTICYAFMQATGMVNDHIVDCFRYAELASLQLGR